MLKDALNEEIMSSRALGYRKITMGLGAVLIGLWWFQDQLDYTNLSFFGVKPREGTAGSRSLLLDALWWLLAYHAVFFAYYAVRDYRAWWRVVVEPNPTGARLVYPEAKMYFGMQPRQPENTRIRANKVGSLTVEHWDRQYEAASGEVLWTPSERDVKKQPEGGTNPYRMKRTQVRAVREKLLWFALVDVGIPGVVAAFGLATLCLS